jgi:hypothetical protein
MIVPANLTDVSSMIASAMTVMRRTGSDGPVAPHRLPKT